MLAVPVFGPKGEVTTAAPLPPAPRPGPARCPGGCGGRAHVVPLRRRPWRRGSGAGRAQVVAVLQALHPQRRAFRPRHVALIELYARMSAPSPVPRAAPPPRRAPTGAGRGQVRGGAAESAAGGAAHAQLPAGRAGRLAAAQGARGAGERDAGAARLRQRCPARVRGAVAAPPLAQPGWRRHARASRRTRHRRIRPTHRCRPPPPRAAAPPPNSSGPGDARARRGADSRAGAGGRQATR